MNRSLHYKFQRTDNIKYSRTLSKLKIETNPLHLRIEALQLTFGRAILVKWLKQKQCTPEIRHRGTGEYIIVCFTISLQTFFQLLFFFLLLFFSFLPYLLSAIYSFSLSSILFYLLCKERKSWVTLEEFNGIFKLFKSQIPLQILFSLYQEKYRFTHNFINNSRKITVPLKSIH